MAHLQYLPAPVAIWVCNSWTTKFQTYNNNLFFPVVILQQVFPHFWRYSHKNLNITASMGQRSYVVLTHKICFSSPSPPALSPNFPTHYIAFLKTIAYRWVKGNTGSLLQGHCVDPCELFPQAGALPEWGSNTQGLLQACSDPVSAPYQGCPHCYLFILTHAGILRVGYRAKCIWCLTLFLPPTHRITYSFFCSL